MATQKSEKKAEKIVRWNRSKCANAVVKAINGKTSLSALSEQAEELFVQHGGEPGNTAAALHSVKRVLESAESFGLVRLTRPSDILVERVK